MNASLFPHLRQEFSRVQVLRLTLRTFHHIFLQKAGENTISEEIISSVRGGEKTIGILHSVTPQEATSLFTLSWESSQWKTIGKVLWREGFCERRQHRFQRLHILYPRRDGHGIPRFDDTRKVERPYRRCTNHMVIHRHRHPFPPREFVLAEIPRKRRQHREGNRKQHRLAKHEMAIPDRGSRFIVPGDRFSRHAVCRFGRYISLRGDTRGSAKMEI